MEIPYRGPWLRFSRGAKSGAPLIRYTTNGILWHSMTEQESWDILVMLRGPDGDNVPYKVKDYTTAKIRGLFFEWGANEHQRLVGDNHETRARGHANRPKGGLAQDTHADGADRHFSQHWNDARGVLVKYFGNQWPYKG